LAGEAPVARSMSAGLSCSVRYSSTITATPSALKRATGITQVGTQAENAQAASGQHDDRCAVRLAASGR
jgi:hypothetical protein